MFPSVSQAFCKTTTSKTDIPAVLADALDLVYHSRAETTQALKQVCLSVPKGSVQMITGPASAGKTSLLLVLAGLLLPTSGQVQLLGHNLVDLTPKQRTAFRNRHVGLLFQPLIFLEALNAVENIEVALSIKGLHWEVAHQEAVALLEDVGLGERIQHFPKQLSGGEQLRLGIARAIAGAPDILFVDDPTVALDKENGSLVMELIRCLAIEQKSTVLIATDDERLTDFADRVAYLEDGRLRQLSFSSHSTGF